MLPALLRGGTLPEEYEIHGRRNAEFEGYIPQTREGATMTNIGKRLYLIAGLSLNLTNSLSVFTQNSFHWARIEIPRTFLARCGHSAVSTNNRQEIVVFGGVNEYIRESNTQSCLNSITIYNIRECSFKDV